MKSLSAVEAIALMFSNIIYANEVQSKDFISINYETLSLHELLP